MGDPVRVGAYLLGEVLGEGGTATVHAAIRVGEGGFRRVVAVKRLREPFACDPDVTAMLLDDARLAGRIVHRNVVPTHDVFAGDGELLVAMDLVHGLSLLAIERLVAPAGMPPRIAASIACDVLAGLHAAHELATPSGTKLDIVHRDVSPANVLVSVDGEAKVIDFGVAKAVGRLQSTRTGVLKGKLAYMAPELFDGACDRRADVYALSLCLWQMIAGRLPFDTDDEGALVDEILSRPVPRPGRFVDGIPAALDAAILRGMERDPALRFATARETENALRAAIDPAPASDVAAWLTALAPDALSERERMIATIEAQAAQRATGESPAPSRDDRRRTRVLVVVSAAVALSASIASAAVLLARGAHPKAAASATAPGPSSASAITPSPPASPAPPSLPATRPAAPAREPLPARAKTRDCAVPTWLDAQGVKHYKSECR